MPPLGITQKSLPPGTFPGHPSPKTVISPLTVPFHISLLSLTLYFNHLVYCQLLPLEVSFMRPMIVEQ
jgi:hypothetical protein